MNPTQEPYLLKAASLYTYVSSFNCAFTVAQAESLCKRVETNRAEWIEKLLASQAFILKDRKSKECCFSIYLVRKFNSSKIRTFINTGVIVGSGGFKKITLAVDYDKLTKKAFAKATPKTTLKMIESNPGKKYHLMELRAREISYIKNEIDFLHQFAKREGLMYSNYTDPNRCIFMKYCNKGSFLEKAPTLTPKAIQLVMNDTLIGLKIMHDSNIVHRDLKPENILVSDDVDRLRARITDYGLSSYENQASGFAGNIQYAAPHKLRQKGFYRAADIWALGLIFYELFYGSEVYESLADTVWDDNNLERSLQELADAYERKFYYDFYAMEGSINQLILGMMHPDPAQALTISAAIKFFEGLETKHFRVNQKIRAIFQGN